MTRPALTSQTTEPALQAPRFAGALAVLAVLACGALLALGLGRHQQQAEQRWRQARFDAVSEDLKDLLEERLRRCSQLLVAVATWAETAPPGDAAAWDRMVRNLGIGAADGCSDRLVWSRGRDAGLGGGEFATAPWLQGPQGVVSPRYAGIHGGAGFVRAELEVERLVAELHAVNSGVRLRVEQDEASGLAIVRPPHAETDASIAGRRFELADGGRPWKVRLDALPGFESPGGWPASRVVQFTGAALTLLAAGLTWLLVRSDLRARRLAQRWSEDAFRQREQALRADAERRQLMDMVPMGVMHIGTQAEILSANRAACRMLGYEPEELLGRHIQSVHEEAEILLRCEQLSAATGTQVVPGPVLFASRRRADGLLEEVEWTLVRRDGSTFPAHIESTPVAAPDGTPIGSVRVFSDVSERRRNSEQIRWLATHDRLTGLPNRAELDNRIHDALARTAAGEGGFALLLLDLDRFKQINDTLGHPVGDQVLIAMAERLQGRLRPTDTVARMGGDEFVVLLPGVDDAAGAMHVGRKLVGAFADELHLQPHRLRVTTSIGVVLHPAHGDDISSLLKAADLAMYRAKAAGRNGVVMFDPVLDAPDAKRLQMESDLRDALPSGQLQVHYQPLVDAASGLPVALEALLRWRHPTLGNVSPAEFIPLAEETGEIVEIGRWVLQQGLADLARWRERWPALRLAANVSPTQLVAPGFEATVRDALAQAGLPPQALELEVTEGRLVAAGTDAVQTLHRLHDLGAGLAVDDFGTGYSALAYLSRFPVTTLKVDRSFVRAIDGHGPGSAPPDGGALASAIVSMARALDLHTVAEGVETEAQRRHLQAIGCNVLQGWLFAAAVPADKLPALLDKLADQAAMAA